MKGHDEKKVKEEKMQRDVGPQALMEEELVEEILRHYRELGSYDHITESSWTDMMNGPLISYARYVAVTALVLAPIFM